MMYRVIILPTIEIPSTFLLCIPPSRHAFTKFITIYILGIYLKLQKDFSFEIVIKTVITVKHVFVPDWEVNVSAVS